MVPDVRPSASCGSVLRCWAVAGACCAEVGAFHSPSIYSPLALAEAETYVPPEIRSVGPEPLGLQPLLQRGRSGLWAGWETWIAPAFDAARRVSLLTGDRLIRARGSTVQLPALSAAIWACLAAAGVAVLISVMMLSWMYCLRSRRKGFDPTTGQTPHPLLRSWAESRAASKESRSASKDSRSGSRVGSKDSKDSNDSKDSKDSRDSRDSTFPDSRASSSVDCSSFCGDASIPLERAQGGFCGDNVMTLNSPGPVEHQIPGLPLCPLLVVPDSTRLGCVIQNRVCRKRQEICFDVSAVANRGGAPLFRVRISELGLQGDSPNIFVETLLGTNELASVSTEGVFRSEATMPMFVIKGFGGRPFASMQKLISGEYHVFREETLLLTFAGDYKSHSVHVVVPGGHTVATTMQTAPEEYQVHMKARSDAGLVVLGLLLIDKCEVVARKQLKTAARRTQEASFSGPQ